MLVSATNELLVRAFLIAIQKFPALRNLSEKVALGCSDEMAQKTPLERFVVP